jgi:hypothetical protein
MLSVLRQVVLEQTLSCSMAYLSNGSNLFNNVACRGGARSRVEFMGYPSQHNPDSMDNSYYSNNYSNKFIRERDFFLRIGYQRCIKRSKARSEQTYFQEQVLQSMR